MNYNKPVKVYRNLKYGRNSRPLYSIMQNGTVVRRSHRILMRDVKFVVYQKGRQRVLNEGRKNVHAFAVGYIVGSAYGADRNSRSLPVQICYNPYNCGSFFDLNGWVNSARVVLLNENGMTAAYVE